jgi:hypothetical protein
LLARPPSGKPRVPHHHTGVLNVQELTQPTSVATAERVRFRLSDLRDERRCLPVVVFDGRLVWVG